MFGFLNGGCDPEYRRLYALCCQNQFTRYGRRSSVFHSYEATFLACLACDVGWLAPPASDAQKCCKLLRRRTDEGWAVDNIPEPMGRFLASFALLLTEIKLDDDIQDSRSWAAATAKLVLRRSLRQSAQFFAQLDGEFENHIEKILLSQKNLEHKSRHPTLDEFCKPTADGFGYLFRLFAEHCAPSEPSESRETDDASRIIPLFEEIGSQLGRAIIAFDCAADWRRDQKRGEFNPLQNETEISAALTSSKRALARISWLCKEIREDSAHGRWLAVRVVRKRFDQVAKQRADLLSGRGQSPRKEMRRPTVGATRSALLYRRGDCDCLADACCSCDCVCGGCDALGSLCQGGNNCVCPCDVCCCATDRSEGGCASKRPEDKEKQQAVRADGRQAENLVGKVGTTEGPLNPQGIVIVGNAEYPAQAESGWIDGGQAVEVVAVQDFGLVVRHRSA